jgi:hypothetical protein
MGGAATRSAGYSVAHGSFRLPLTFERRLKGIVHDVDEPENDGRDNSEAVPAVQIELHSFLSPRVANKS